MCVRRDDTRPTGSIPHQKGLNDSSEPNGLIDPNDEKNQVACVERHESLGKQRVGLMEHLSIN